MSSFSRFLALGALLSGCTVVAPNLQVTSVSFPTVVAGGTATPSEDPWPQHGPTAAPTVTPVPKTYTFSGHGRQGHLGPVTLGTGQAKLHVVYDSATAFAGDFALELDDGYDRYQADLASGTGSFDRVLTPSIAISGDHYLNVTAADGYWTIRVN